MIAVASRLVSASQDEPPTEREIRDRLRYCCELLREHDAGLTNKVLTRAEIWARLDGHLEELCQMKQLWWNEDREKKT